MPFYLRIITKNRWYRDSPPSWLPENEIPAQSLADLVPKPEENVSLWRIEDDQSNLSRVVAAIASNRQKLDKLDYALFPIAIIDQLGLTVAQSPGKTPDDVANATWHWEIIELTASKAVLLAKEVYSRAEITRKWPMDLRRLIQEGIHLSHLTKSKLHTELLAALN